MKKFNYGVARGLTSEPLICYMSFRRAKSFVKDNKQHHGDLVVVKMKDKKFKRGY